MATTPIKVLAKFVGNHAGPMRDNGYRLEVSTKGNKVDVKILTDGCVHGLSKSYKDTSEFLENWDNIRHIK